MKKLIQTSKAPAAIGPYSQAVQVKDTLFVSGQIPVNPVSGQVPITVEEQTQQTLQNIAAILKEANFTVEQVVKCSIFIKEMKHFSAINEVYASFFGQSLPARETVEVSRLPKDVLIEISCVAMRG
ncbi:MAG: RidA family protein [Cyclobacteriaceae bacterium]